MGILLFILSVVISVILLPIGILYGLIYSFVDQHFDIGLKKADDKFLALAKAIDKYGNVACAELFNHTLIKKESVHKFGDIKETISAVIGHNLLAGTLTRTGKALNWILDEIDKNHSVDAIEGK
jgi:hypothetical protein